MLTTEPLHDLKCALCAARGLVLARRGNLESPLAARDFAVTDDHYGVTADIHRCPACGFLQCASLPDPLPYYEALEDEAYDQGRKERRLQERRVLEIVSQSLPSSSPEGSRGRRLLDIGAATGVLVEEARRMGFEAAGIEPCRAFQRRAAELGLPVHLGTFPHAALPGPFDIVTLVDVLEHVLDPIGLLRAVSDVLTETGVGAIVTPDVGSVAARLMGKRWWHYRSAHVGYYTRATLFLALAKAGLEPIAVRRPTWVFAGDYLLARALRYLPRPLRIRPPGFLNRIAVPLNLRDSLLVLCRRKNGAR